MEESKLLEQEATHVRPAMIVGLGNPGRKYEDTRHNIGFTVLDGLAAAWGCGFGAEGKWRVELARSQDGIILAKPQTYMNLSGESIGPLARFHRISPERILVVVDDLDLSFGRLRMRPKGSHGGHNGLKSLIQHLGTSGFPRLKLGIGKDGDREVVGHVLGKFDDLERSGLEKFVNRAIDAIRIACRDGLEAAMNVCNAPESAGVERRPKAYSPSTSPEGGVGNSTSDQINPDKKT